MAYISFTCKNIKLWTKKDGRGRIIRDTLKEAGV
jgi:hypothetical protein